MNSFKINGGNKSVLDKEAINNFREYLRIPSVHPKINYDECIKFLKRQANLLNLPYQIFHCTPTTPIIVITWTGTEPNLPSIWLNSHMDVVPVYEDKWTYKPFDAHMDENGDIYARGAQDMKCLGIQFLEAIKRLRRECVTLKRTVHIAFVPEEELGGIGGMRDFTVTEDFRKLNVGFSIDESMPTPSEEFIVFYGERFVWQICVHCPGEQGHGSFLMENPAGNKLGVIIQKFNNFRAQELKKLKDDPKLQLGDVTSINLTKIEGGVQVNVVPPEFIATYDIRIAGTVNPEKFEAEINSWCKEAGEGVWIEFTDKELKIPYTNLDDSNIFWTAFKKATDDLNLKINEVICPGVTDSRYLRQLGIPAIGFSPMDNTLLRLHDNDEYLNAKTFLKGIDYFVKIIPAVANVE